MLNYYSVIEFENTVEIHPIIDEKDQAKTPIQSWDEAKELALKTVQGKITTHENHLNEWNDPKDNEIVLQLKICYNNIKDSNKDNYIEEVFWGT